MKKKKLSLTKKTITTLSDSQKNAIKGGDLYTTSFTNCTHFACCGDTCQPTGSLLDTSCCPYTYNGAVTCHLCA